MKRTKLFLLTTMLIIGIAGCGSSTPENQDTKAETQQVGDGETTKAQETEVQTTEAVTTAEPETSAEKADGEYFTNGTFKVGTDMPAGEYLIMSAWEDKSFGGSYFELSSDSSGNMDSIITNDNFIGQRYVTVKDGEYLKIDSTSMAFYVDDTKDYQEPSRYNEGMYRVGKEIPAGEYKVKIEDGSEYAYIEVDKDSRGTADSIITNEVLTGETYITVEDGQYLKLTNGAYIEK